MPPRVGCLDCGKKKISSATVSQLIVFVYIQCSRGFSAFFFCFFVCVFLVFRCKYIFIFFCFCVFVCVFVLFFRARTTLDSDVALPSSEMANVSHSSYELDSENLTQPVGSSHSSSCSFFLQVFLRSSFSRTTHRAHVFFFFLLLFVVRSLLFCLIYIFVQFLSGTW